MSKHQESYTILWVASGSWDSMSDSTTNWATSFIILCNTNPTLPIRLTLCLCTPYLFSYPRFPFFPPEVLVFCAHLTPSCSNRGGEWHEPRMLSGRLVPIYRPPTSRTHFVQHKGSTQLTEILTSQKGISNSTYFTSMVDRNNYTNVFLSQKSSHGIKFQLQLQKDPILQLLQIAANLCEDWLQLKTDMS